MMRTACCSLALIATLSAAEPASAWPRLVGEVLVGTAGFEPGVAAEWTVDWGMAVRLRPEILLNFPDLPGIAGSATVPLAVDALPSGQELWIGPRLVFHNERYDGGKKDDDIRYGFGAEVIGIYVIPIVPSQPGRHVIEVIGAAGLVDHDDDVELSLTIGAAYGYQF